MKYEPDVKVLDDSAKVETKGCSLYYAEGHCALIRNIMMRMVSTVQDGDNDSIKTRLIKYVIWALVIFRCCIY